MLSYGIFATVDDARKLLTPRRVLAGPQDLLPYMGEELQECQIANRVGQSDWRLVYCEGLSLRAQWERYGLDFFSPFMEEDLLAAPAEYPWIEDGQDPGYRLIDFNGRWGMMGWETQEKRIGEMGPLFARAPETLILEAVYGFSQATGDSCLLPDWYHMGLMHGVGICARIGCIVGDDGCNLDLMDIRDWDLSYRVCVLRHPETPVRK
jgi:hypothetical protein